MCYYLLSLSLPYSHMQPQNVCRVVLCVLLLFKSQNPYLSRKWPWGWRLLRGARMVREEREERNDACVPPYRPLYSLSLLGNGKGVSKWADRVTS